MSDPSPLTELRGIMKRFPGTIACDQVDLRVYPGEIHVLLGENGAGKTTLMQILYGIQQPDAGEIWIDGKIDRSTGVIVGINAPQRVEVSSNALPGTRYILACLVVNGPLAEPRGGIFMRYATLAFESPG